jgi:uracil phosphoribosyltransferase
MTTATASTTIPHSPAIQATCAHDENRKIPPSVFKLPQTAQLEALYTIIRDKETSRGDFLFYSDRIIRLLVEEGLNHLPVFSRTIETPTVSEGLTMGWIELISDEIGCDVSWGWI